MAVVDGCSGGRIYCTQKNKFNKGDEIEVLSPVGSPVKFTVEEMFDEYDNSIDTANHAAMKMSIRSDLTFPEHSIIRMKKIAKKPCDFPHMAFCLLLFLFNFFRQWIRLHGLFDVFIR